MLRKIQTQGVPFETNQVSGTGKVVLLFFFCASKTRVGHEIFVCLVNDTHIYIFSLFFPRRFKLQGCHASTTLSAIVKFPLFSLPSKDSMKPCGLTELAQRYTPENEPREITRSPQLNQEHHLNQTSMSLGSKCSFSMVHAVYCR